MAEDTTPHGQHGAQDSAAPEDSDGDQSVALPTAAAELSGDETPPQAEPESPAVEDPSANPEYWRDTRVMLLEDDQDDAALIESSLRAVGVREVVPVKSVSQAYYQLCEDTELFPDVLVLELVLAGSSGLTLLARLRSSPSEVMRKLPAVVVTHNDSPSVFRRAANHSISVFLRKPISTAQLRDALVRARTGKVVEMPLDFGRSWIDEIEDAEDKAEAAPRPSFLQRVLAFFWRPRRKRIDFRA